MMFMTAKRIPTLWRVQRLQHFSKSRTGVRLFEEFGDRREDK